MGRCTVLVGWEGAWSICVGFGLTCNVIIGGLLHEMDLVFVFWIPEPVTSLWGGCPIQFRYLDNESII